MSELKPCPFCGDSSVELESGRHVASGLGYSADVNCECGASGAREYANTEEDAKERAVAAWNRRADPPEAP